MSGDNLTQIIKSKAVSALVITFCVILIMKQLPGAIMTIKEMKKSD